MVPLYLLVDRLGLIDNHLAVILPSIVTAFAIFFFRQNMKRIPTSLDAAKIDGSTILGRYWRVVLPLIKPAIGTIMIFSFMQSWTEFLWPLRRRRRTGSRRACGRP